MTGTRTTRIAHAYGNTRRDLQAALAAEIDIIEADVWFRGGEVHVRHESRLGVLPILADKRIRGRVLPPLSVPLWGGYYLRLDLAAMLLEELLDTVAGKTCLLLDTKGVYDEKECRDFVRTIAEVMYARSATDWVAVCGQFWPLLEELLRAVPAVEVRYSIETPAQWERFMKLAAQDEGARKICIEHRFLTENKAQFLREHHVSAYCWTVDDEASAGRALTLGADGVISNNLCLLTALA